MVFQRKKVASALGLVLGVGGVGAGIAPALAQDIRVDVTGSNIRRVEGESALPVTVLTREEIDRTGSQTAAELLQYVSANNSGGAVFNTNVIGAQTYSVSTAGLRGLGGQNTLILINGKRITTTSGELQGVYGVNLDSIPFSAIERVEVLKDGASAVYGSDAVGGVINFILRQDFRGAEATVYYGAPTRSGGGEKWNASGTVGFGDLAKDKYNVFFNAYYGKHESLNGVDRNFADSSVDIDQGLVGISGNTFPGHITTGNIGSPTFPNCLPSIYNPDLGERCWFDPSAAEGVNIIPEQEITSFYASGRWQFNPNWQAYGTFAYSKVETRYVIQPTPISDQFFYGPNQEFQSTVLLQPTSPFYPTALAEAAGVGGQPLNVRYRAYSLGLRDQTDENEAYQGVVGVKGTAFNWDFDFDFIYSRNETNSRTNNGFTRFSQILPLLNSGIVNLFGENTPEVQAQIDATQFRENTIKGESTGYLFEGKATGDLFKLPAGSLAAAAGFQVGKQELKQTFNPALNTGDITGFGGNNLNIDADRDYWAAFVEFNIPIVKNLELNAAVRYDDYSDFGNTTNPKFSLRWNPMRELLFRGSWGTGFVAPTLTQAFGANTTGVSLAGQVDPLRCPTTQDSNDCNAQFNVLFGGNPNLDPQRSTQWTLGVVFEPVPRVSLSFDYFNIDVKDGFSNGPSVTTILSDQDNPSPQFGNLVTRAAPDPAFPGIPGRIIQIDQRFINLTRQKIEGFDINIKADSPPTDWGRFSFNLDGTYYTKFDVQQLDGSYASLISNHFEATVNGINPRYKQYATVTWTRGPWSAALGNQFQSSYVDFQAVGETDEGEPITRRVGTLSLWDLYGSYTGFKNWKLTLGVQNLFDRDAPFSNQQLTFQAGYDPSYYDARARFVYGSVQYSFQ